MNVQTQQQWYKANKTTATKSMVQRAGMQMFKTFILHLQLFILLLEFNTGKLKRNKGFWSPDAGKGRAGSTAQ